jgi:4,5-dihydroxyphthalate decarboxylase
VDSLKVALGTYGHTKPLKDGRVKAAGFDLEFVEVSPLVAAYRKMVRELAYDVCEVAVTTYIVAKSFDKGFTALPLPLNHMFHFGDVQVGTDTGIDKPADLAGKRVGVRAYTVTTGVWARGILQSEYGVDPASIAWVTDDEEHVTEYQAPSNVAHSGGDSLVSLFQSGKIDAAFAGPAGLGRTGAPQEGWDKGNSARSAVHTTRDYRPLFQNAAELDREWYARTGIYPIHGVVCVKDSLLAQRPEVVKSLYDVFCAGKAAYLSDLAKNGAINADDQKWTSMQKIVGPDPLPFGLEANRRTIDALTDFAFAQKLIPKRYRAEELFASL